MQALSLVLIQYPLQVLVNALETSIVCHAVQVKVSKAGYSPRGCIRMNSGEGKKALVLWDIDITDLWHISTTFELWLRHPARDVREVQETVLCPRSCGVRDHQCKLPNASANCLRNRRIGAVLERKW